MLDFNTALELMKKYGYDSASLHPFIYSKDNTIGICYSYVDDNFGILERTFYFSTVEEMDQFLKEFKWCKEHGKENNVRMILDNYEIVNPKVLYLRNEKVMVKDEMFNIEYYDQMEDQKKEMDQMSRILLEASNLIQYYETNKQGQMDYFRMVLKKKNDLRQKYYDLQNKIDSFNKVENIHQLRLLPELFGDCGINANMEIATKDRLSQYKAKAPSFEEAIDFVHEVWELNESLENNYFYFNTIKEENAIDNETIVVDKKLALINKVMESNFHPFGVDLISKFRKINRECKANETVITDDFLNTIKNGITAKYSKYEKIDYLNACDYLKEAMTNNNYDQLAEKYSPKAVVIEETVRYPKDKVKALMGDIYKNNLSVSEQAILTLYNTRFKRLFEYILQVPDFVNKPVLDLINTLSSYGDFAKLKKECYEDLKMSLDEAQNLKIKNSVFANIKFDSFENFITSIAGELNSLLQVKNRMILPSDLTLYFKLFSFEELNSKYIYPLTDDLNSLVGSMKSDNEMIGLVLLKKDTPVLYSPYTVDFGKANSKEAVTFNIKSSQDVNMLVDVNNVVVLRDENLVNVVKYFSEPIKENGVAHVEDLKVRGKTSFCKFTISSNIKQQTVVQESVPPIVEAPKVPEVPNQPTESNEQVKKELNNAVETSTLVSQDVVNGIENGDVTNG